MSKKKIKYQKKSFESTLVSNDTSSNIYESMLLSSAWKDLTSRQKLLYIYCKSQYYSEKTTYENNPYTFTMNKYKWCNKYNLYTNSNSASFYKDMEELIKHGFVACIKCGAIARQKNIYIYSDKWIQWKTPQFEVTKDEMTLRMINKMYKDNT